MHSQPLGGPINARLGQLGHTKLGHNYSLDGIPPSSLLSAGPPTGFQSRSLIKRQLNARGSAYFQSLIWSTELWSCAKIFSDFNRFGPSIPLGFNWNRPETPLHSSAHVGDSFARNHRQKYKAGATWAKIWREFLCKYDLYERKKAKNSQKPVYNVGKVISRRSFQRRIRLSRF